MNRMTGLLILSFIVGLSCKSETSIPVVEDIQLPQEESAPEDEEIHSLHDESIEEDIPSTTIHVLVALCDNKYQGIVPVPKILGNGQDPRNNLYWGAAYGVKTYFKKSAEWHLIQTTKDVGSSIMERLVFRHIDKNLYLVADAYDGRHIKKTTRDFLEFSSGNKKDKLVLEDGSVMGIGGQASLIAYLGHDGLMDFQINEEYKNTDGIRRDVIIPACFSKSYFEPHLTQAKVNPLVWSTGLMAPEAYVLHDALSSYIENNSNEEICTRAAQAYSKYQKCSLRAAQRLLVTQ